MKKAYIGAFDTGCLNSQNRTMKIIEEISGIECADINQFFYMTSFQAGLDQFVTKDYRSAHINVSDFIKKRSIFLDDGPINEVHRKVNDLFCSYLPKDYHLDANYKEVFKLENFLCDIIISMSGKSSLISAYGPPDIEKVRALLHQDLYIPISNLMLTIEKQGINGVLPSQKKIQGENLTRFAEIMESDLYGHYSDAQSMLDYLDSPMSKSVKKIRQTAGNLIEKYPDLIYVKQGTSFILKSSPKLIETVLGKLGGTVAEIAVDAGRSLLKEQRNIVIYDYGSTISDLWQENVQSMMLRVLEKNGPDEFERVVKNINAKLATLPPLNAK